MSLNIKLELPIETVVAIEDAFKTGSNARALEMVHNLADQVLLDAIKEIPYKIRNSDTPSATSTLSHAPPADDTRPAKKRKLAGPEEIKVYVKTLQGVTHRFFASSGTTVDNLKYILMGRIDAPVDGQRFIYAGNQLEDGRELEDYKITNTSILHLVRRLKGS